MNPSDPLLILLVEDNDADADLTQRELRRAKLFNTIERVEDGAAALDFLFGAGAYAGRDVADAPAVILLDLNLPKVHGLDVLRQLRADPRTHAIPVVVMTSSNEDRDIQTAYDLGANSYIVKPIGFVPFTKVVAEVGLYWAVVNRGLRPPPRT